MTSLRDEALKVLEELDLIALLNGHGEARLVGSVALDLVVKTDIDVHLFTKADPIAAVNRIYPLLLDHPRIREVRLTDYRSQQAVKIGVDHYPGPTQDWSIDIWVTDKPASLAWGSTEETLRLLTPETRAAILAIKQHYHAQGRLRDGLSARIYHAVLHQNARTVTDIKKHNPNTP